MPKTVLFIVSSIGFQPIEYTVPKKILEDAGYTVVTASNAPQTAIASDKKTKAKVDLTLNQINVTNYQAVVFIGGPGTTTNLDQKESYIVAQNAVDKFVMLAAICLAPRVLAKSRILVGKYATGWNGDGNLPALLLREGSLYTPNQNVVVDTSGASPVITATGPEAAQEFGQTILRYLNALTNQTNTRPQG